MAKTLKETKLWLTRVEPLEGESISHFLGRFRRAKGNKFSTPCGLGQVSGLGAVLARWEKFYFNPFPTFEELEALANVVEVDVNRLREMLPLAGVGMKHKPIRLCGACYAEEPYHLIAWQFKTTAGCDRHQLRLLSKCPICEKPFPIPALWIEGRCLRCLTFFAEMVDRQKAY
ncbi:TniQ family protein [Scytonema millei]|uniref:TniQ domain-containing protein n=1 Tax=Scytonema millei VB511283 TaxID=1245923 RepID=A0A9X5EA38_9CYAN|nr:TniQ family protein [Scytonema millei]NHC36882.1 hypothetical protein [Scytonema millei VB511283]